jgi:hypothetical protein
MPAAVAGIRGDGSALLGLLVVSGGDAELPHRVDQTAGAEPAPAQRDAPDADVLLGREQGAAVAVDDHALDLRVLARLLARRPPAPVRQRERGREVDRVDALVGPALAGRDEP